MNSLYKHQEEALNILKESSRGIINLPTGTGKTTIQAYTVAENIKFSKDPKVYVILAPRILLANQLFSEIKSSLLKSNIDAQYLIVHSGNYHSDLKWMESIRKIEIEKGIPFRQIESTTSSKGIKEYYKKALEEKVSLVIISTYDSAKRIVDAEIPIEIIQCDEAHYLVPGIEDDSVKFAWIPSNFEAQKKFYYTATMKFTNGNYGMNNPALFGSILYQKLPIEMIKDGIILRPRIHLVDAEAVIGMSDIDKDAAAICNAFKEHRALLAQESCAYIAPKLLVVAQGSEHLDNLVNHPEILVLREARPNLTIFDISSTFEPRINGEKVKREEFLKRIQELTDMDEAIIIHIRILKEGIDVPGITGVMPLNNLKQSDFLQTLGRATRLHKTDREKLINKIIGSNDLIKFIKPYAWIIIPTYGDLGSEIKEDLIEIVKYLRTFDFNPNESIFVKTSKGQVSPQSLEGINKLDQAGKEFHLFVGNITHEIESWEEANKIAEKLNELENMSLEERLLIKI